MHANFGSHNGDRGDAGSQASTIWSNGLREGGDAQASNLGSIVKGGPQAIKLYVKC